MAGLDAALRLGGEVPEHEEDLHELQVDRRGELVAAARRPSPTESCDFFATDAQPKTVKRFSVSYSRIV